MNKHLELGFMTLTFIVNAIVSKDKGDEEDCIFQIGQAKGMWFTLKVMGFDIEEMKDDLIERVSKEETMPKSEEVRLQAERSIELFEDVHKDVVNHIDQIMGGMLLDDAQR